MREVDFILSGTNLIGVLLLLTLLTMTPSLSSLEGRVFPVVTDVVVTDRGLDEDGDPIFDTSFTKSRNCRFDHIVWYGPGGELAGLRLPEAAPDRPPVSRTPGPQVSKGWRLKSAADLRRTQAYVYHRCHIFWTTRTLFWRGDLAPPAPR